MLKKITKYIFFIIVALYSFNAFSSCLKEGDRVRLSGVISEKIYYGPPGWGEDKKNDKKLYEWILRLNKKLTCVDGADTGEAGWDQNVQLIMHNNNDYKKKSFLGREVSVEGIVFLAETGYHMTPVLLDDTSFVTTDK